MAMLLLGSTGADVKSAQAALNFHAYPSDVLLTPDGKFGNMTQARTRAFQEQAGLKPDGIIGPLTECELFATTDVCLAIRRLSRSARYSAKNAGGQRNSFIATSVTSAFGPASPPFPGVPALPPILSPLPPSALLVPGLPLKFKMDVKLHSGVPVALPPPPSPPSPDDWTIEILKVSGKAFQPLVSKKDPAVLVQRPFVDGSGPLRIEAIADTAPSSEPPQGFSASVYTKAVMVASASDPGEAELKLKSGVTFDWRAGVLSAHAGAHMPFWTWSSAHGTTVWKPKFEAMLTFQVQFWPSIWP